MRVTVNHDRCQANGVCMRMAPQVFQVGGDGTLHVLQEQPGADQHRTVRDAVRRCPTQAITVQA